MDSLLDALTNVVGILVIVLVAVQISSQEAARRMEEMIEKIDPKEQQKIEQESAEAKAELAAIEAALKEEKNREKIDPEKLLASLKEELAAAQEKAKQDLLLVQTAEKEAEEKRLAAEEIRQRLLVQLAELEEKEKKFIASKDDLFAKLEDTPIPKPPPPKEVRPPTPRDVPRDPKNGNALLQARTVLVKDGKIIPFVDPGKIMETAIKNRLKMIIQKNNIQVGEGNYITDANQAQKLIDEFNSDPAKNKYFDISMLRQGNRIRIQITPTEECGEEPQDAVRGIFNTVMRNNQKKWYLKYLVEPESFEAYMAIRKVTDRAGYYAGWSPIDPGSYKHIMDGGYGIGKKPPPRPPNRNKPGPVKGVLD